MAISVKLKRTGKTEASNTLLVTAGSADTGQLQIQLDGTDIYNNLSGGTADILSGATNTTITLPLDSTTKQIEKGVYRINFVASVGSSDDQLIDFQISELDPIISQEVSIYSPYIRIDDNTNYLTANTTVSASTRTVTLKYPAGSNQSNLTSTTTDVTEDLAITTANVWTGASQATLNYDLTYTVGATPYAGGTYLSFTYQEIGSGYESINIDQETTLSDLYDKINNLRQRVAAANLTRRSDYATLLSDYQYVGALMSQFREAISSDKTEAAEDIISQIRYIVGSGVATASTSKASKRVYGASSQITMTISDSSLEVQNVDTIVFSGATLADDGDGQVTVTISGGGGSGTVTNVTGVSPVTVVSGTTTPQISVATADSATTGALSSTDWNIFNSKQGAITLTTSGTSGAATLSGTTLNIPQYSGGGGGVSEVTGVSPISVVSGTTTPAISIATADSATTGVLSSTDWTTFNSGIITNTSAISTLDGEVVKKADYTPAHSILVQQSGTGTPASLSVATDTLVGRLSGGSSEIDSLTPTEVRTLLNVEDGADVTDTTNVTAAGALMDSEVINLDQVKAFDSTDYATAAQGTLADSALQNVVEDTTPQLGGDLDTQGNAITGNYATDGHRTSIIESTSARTLSLTDAGDRILFQNASASTCTIPTNATVAFPIDTEIDLVDMTDGLLTVEAATGVTLNGVSAGSTATTAKWAGVTLIKIATDSWLAFGKINDVV